MHSSHEGPVICRSSLFVTIWVAGKIRTTQKKTKTKTKTDHCLKNTVATFIAKVGGDPIPNVKWMKGKWRQLNQGGRIIIQQRGDEAKLEIKDTTKTDSGMYKCVAFNQHGEIERSVNLQVEERKQEVVEEDVRGKLKRYTQNLHKLIPTKKKEDEEQTIDILELLKNVDPKEYEKYARMYGITDFRGLLQAFELLKQTREEESHRLVRYIATTASFLLRFSISCVLKPEKKGWPFWPSIFCLDHVPVTLIRDIENQTVLTDEDAIFECEIKINYPEIKLSWYKGTQKLDSSDKYEIKIEGDRHILKIRNCQLEDQGNYRIVCGPHIASARLTVIGKCILNYTAREAQRGQNNIYGKERRDTITVLSLAEGDPYFTGKLQDYTAVEKDEVILQCEISKADAPVKWMKDGKPITPSKNVVIKADGKKRILILKKALKKDIGQYTCDCGTDQTSANLNIEAAPRIKTGDQNLVVDVGKPLTMTVPYDAYPRAEAEWLKGEESLPTTTVDTTTDCTTFKIYEAKKSDKGRYKVVLRNKHGQAEAFINVEVIDVPGPVRNLEVTEIYDGEVGLAWQEPESDGGSKIIGYVVERRDIKRKTWIVATDHAENCEYTVTGLQKGGVEYLFRVSARNRVGTGEPVETERPVEAKSKFGEQKFGATLTWEAPEYDGGSPITGYIIELRNRASIKWEPTMTTGADELSAVLTDVVENEEYFFRVRAQNMVGVGKPSHPTRAVKIMDPIERPSPPINLDHSDQTKTSVQLTWEPPLEDGGSPILGYIIERREEGTDKWIRCNPKLVPVTGLKAGSSYYYRVSAENAAGVSDPAEAIGPLTAEDPFGKLYVKLLAGLTVKAGTKIELPAKITGKPEPQITWTKAEKILRPDDRITIETKPDHSTVTITDSKRSDSGTYIIEAVNSKITNESCLLTWNPPRDDGGSKITNYILEKRATDSEIWHKLSSTIKDTSFRATNLTPHKEYVFRVSAENMYGIGEPAQCNPIIAKYAFG
uniref:Titin n=1 Tax=Pavo cristatus TaxID=9049 RepID=A0A8C9EWG0_PAVCR